MARLRLPGGPRPGLPLAAAAVVVVALVGGGLFVVARGGGPGGSGAADRGTQVAPGRLTVTPRNKATRVALDAEARGGADSGRLRAVRVTAAGGKRLKGELAEDGRSWVSS